MEEFQRDLMTKSITWVYRKYLLGHDTWYFRSYLSNDNHAEVYDDMKIYMSEKLNIHVNNIAIVGSAKLGYSISPKVKKLFKVFSDKSDIDIAIVSPIIFEKSWSAFLELSQKGYLHNYQSITSNIFRGFVSLKYPDHRSSFFREWNGMVEPCKRDLQTSFSISHDINYRIYQSWESVENYHCNGLLKLKDLIEEKND